MIGTRLTIDNLKKISKAVSEKERKRLYKLAAKPLIAQAKANTPVDEGVLRKSIKVLPLRTITDSIYVGPRVRKGKKGDAHHAHLVEYGSVNNKPIGYMRRAYEGTKGAVKGVVETGLISKYRKAITSVSNG